MSILFAFQGLDTVLSIAVPFIIFLDPPAISLILLTLIQAVVKQSVVFYWTYRLALWTSVIWSALTVISAQGWGTGALEPVLSLAPGQAVDLGWIMPTFIAAVIGLIVDVSTKTDQKHSNSVTAAADADGDVVVDSPLDAAASPKN